MKRVLSLILAIVIMAGICASAPVVAAEEATQEVLTYKLNSTGDGYSVICYDSELAIGVIEIPEEYNGLPVTEISQRAFYQCKKITEVKIPESCTVIGGAAFEYCDNLISVNFPSKLKTIQHSAFLGTALESAVLPESVTSIGPWAFRYCKKLKEVYLGDNIKYIGSLVFEGTPVYKDAKNWDGGACGKGGFYIGKYLVYGNYIEGAYEVREDTLGFAEDVFDYHAKVTELTLNKSLQYIGGSWGYRLSKIIVPDECKCVITKNDIWHTAFYNDKSNWSNGILYLGANLIEASTNATSLSVKDGIMHIAPKAFQGNNTIKTVELPDSIENIGEYAFSKCSALETIAIPQKVSVINFRVFFDCENLSEVYLHRNIKKIENGAFASCNSMEKVHIEDINSWFNIDVGILSDLPTSNGAGLYINNELLTEIVVPDGIETIGKYVLKNCEGVETIILSNDVKKIEEKAFSGCVDAKKIVLNDGLEEIGQGAFAGCISLPEIEIPSSVNVIQSSAFANCPALEKVYFNDVASWCDIHFYNDSSNPLSNGADLYINNQKVVDLTIPEGTEEIKSFAFTGAKIKSVSLPDSVISVGVQSFADCDELSSVVLNEGLNSLLNKSFASCDALEQITLPESIQDITTAFYECKSLQSIKIPDNVKIIGGEAFKDCIALKTVTLPNSAARIGNNAFINCSSLESIRVPGSVEKIDPKAFYNCTTLSNVVLENGITNIGESAFERCESLKQINFPEGLVTIGNRAFYYCVSLEGNIVLPDSLTSIPTECFYMCKNLKGVQLGNATTKIQPYAFQATGIESIVLPETIKSISYNAFDNCRELVSVHLPSGDVSYSNNVFTVTDESKAKVLNPKTTFYGKYNSYAEKYVDNIGGKFVSTNDEGHHNMIFQLNEDGASYSIIDCWAENAVIPEEYNGLPVTTFANISEECRPKIKSIHFSKNMQAVDTEIFKGCTELASFTVDSDHPDMTSKNGVLFSKDMTVLGMYPSGKKDATYSVPSTVKTIATGAFVYNDYLTTLKLNSGLQEISDAAFYNMKVLSSVSFPKTLKRVGSCAFFVCPKLKIYKLPSKLEEIGYYAFGYYPTGTGDDAIICKYKGIKIYADAGTLGHYYAYQFGFAYVDTGVVPAKVSFSVANHKDGVQIKWKAIGNADSYKIYRKAKGSTKWVSIKETTSTSYIDKTAKSGTTYYYTVRAKNGKGMSSYNKAGKSITYVAVANVKSLSNVDGGIKITWNKVSGATSYVIYRSGPIDSGTKKIATVKGTSYIDKKVVVGGDYYYYVIAVKGSAKSAKAIGDRIWYISTPTLSKAVNVTGGVKVSWKSVTNADVYKVYRKSGKGKWSYIGSSKTTSYVDKTAKSGTTYYYTVKAGMRICEGEDYIMSGYKSKGVSVKCISAPTIKSVTNKSNGVTVSWGKVAGAKGYYLYRKTTGGWTKIATLTGTSYTDKKVKSGTTYTYTVKAYYNSKVYSGAANSMQIKYLTVPKLSKAVNSKDGVTVSWSKISGATEYKVYRKSSSGSWSQIGTSSTTSFVDETAASGTTYYYTVRACCGKFLSAYNTTGVSVKYLAAPELINAEGKNDSIVIYWNSVPGAQGYYLYRKTTDGWTKIATVKGNGTVSYVDTTAQVGVTYTYTIKAYNGKTTSASKSSASGMVIENSEAVA